MANIPQKKMNLPMSKYQLPAITSNHQPPMEIVRVNKFVIRTWAVCHIVTVNGNTYYAEPDLSDFGLDGNILDDGTLLMNLTMTRRLKKSPGPVGYAVLKTPSGKLRCMPDIQVCYQRTGTYINIKEYIAKFGSNYIKKEFDSSRASISRCIQGLPITDYIPTDPNSADGSIECIPACYKQLFLVGMATSLDKAYVTIF